MTRIRNLAALLALASLAVTLTPPAAADGSNIQPIPCSPLVSSLHDGVVGATVQYTVAMANIGQCTAIAEANNVVSMVKPENQAAAQAIIGAFLSSLLLATKRILWVLFVVLIVAVVTAPYPWAVRARAWVGDVGRAGVGAVRGAQVGPAAAWVGERRDALMLAGAVIAAIFLLFASISLGWFLVLAVVLALYELAVYRIAAASRVETAETGV